MFEGIRSWIAYRIFPELNLYMEASKRIGAVEENNRCIKALEDGDSACSDWAIDVIRIKYITWDEIKEKYGH